MSNSYVYVFIVAITSVVFDPSDTAVSEPFWSVARIRPPVVKVEFIGQDESRIPWTPPIAEIQLTAHRFKRLRVPLHSTLGLQCTGVGPLEWTRNGEPISNSNVSSTYILKEDHYSVENVVVFRTRLRIHNTTFDETGQYTCSVRVPKWNTTIEDVQWSFSVIVEPVVTDQPSEPRILTPILDEVQLSKVSHSRIRFAFNVLTPVGMEFKERFVLPDRHETVQLYANSCRRFPDGTTIFSSPGRSGRRSAFLDLGSARFEKTFQHHGTYKYIFQYKATNGSWSEVSREITVFPQDDASSLLDQYAEMTTRDTFRVHLTLGRYYTLANNDFNAAINGTFETLIQSLTDCDFIRVPTASQHDTCGVLNVKGEKYVQGRNTSGGEELLNWFSVSLKVVRSCAFRIQLWSAERRQSIMKTIYVKAVEAGYDTMPREEEVAFSTTDGDQDKVEKYTNESISIQCRFPVCGWEMMVLCKHAPIMDCVRLRRENSTYISFSDKFFSSKINISFVALSNSTLALELQLDKLELRHTGVYGCGEIQSSSYTRSEFYHNEEMAFNEIWSRMHFINFQLTVLQPKAPRFTDGESTFQESLLNGGEATLYCPFTGSPEPLIIWTQRREFPSSNGTGKDRPLELKVYTNKTSVTVRNIGMYECHAKNRFGENSRSFNVKAPESTRNPLSLLVGLSVTAAIVLAVFAMAIVTCQRRQAKKALFKELAQLLSEPSGGVQLDVVLPLNDQADILPYNTNYEIDRNRFQLIKVIGDGEFGQVFRGEFQISENQRRYVAVKVPKNPLKPEHHQALISELKIMIYLRPHVNVLALVGACTNELEQRQQLFVLTEYCEKGSLLSYLQDHILDFESQAPEFGIQSLLDFAYQAANGMEHLAAWKIIHRDLAVRNLLLTHRGVIKIADFGLSRQKETVYSYNKFLFRNVRLPVAWMAPESVTRYEYTHKSDVWSFGIVLWEMFSCGRVPYSNVDVSGMEIIQWLREGNRLSMPALATNEMYSLMLECWATDPTGRPTFSQSKSQIARHVEDTFPSNYTSLLLLLSSSFCQMGATQQASSATLTQEASIGTSEAQHDESVAIEMESSFLHSLSDDFCAVSAPASIQYVGSAEANESGGENNLTFEEEEPENEFAAGGDIELPVGAVFNLALPEQQDALDDTPLLG